jgi:hypothetical protein
MVRVRGENRFGPGYGPWSNFTDPAHGNGFTLSPPQAVTEFQRHYFPPVNDMVKLSWNRLSTLNETGGETNDHNVVYDLYAKSFHEGYAGNVHCAVDDATVSSCYPRVGDNQRLIGGLDEWVDRGEYWVATLNASTTTFEHHNLNASDVWYYKLYARNRGAFPSLVTKYSARVVGCPVVPIQSPQLSVAFDAALYLYWTGVASYPASDINFNHFNFTIDTAKGWDIDSEVYYKLYHNSSDPLATRMDASDRTQYSLVHQKYFNTSLQQVAKLPLSTTSFNHTDLPMGSYNPYVLTIVNSVCEGPASPEVTYRTLWNVPDMPEQPQIVNGTTLPSLTIRWNTTRHASHYRINIQHMGVQYDPLADDDELLMALHHGNFSVNNDTVMS